ncbi:bacillopeptidase F [Minicystis rosea]|nr:bacillopeptidase F [Minicystis rosea]
MKNTSSLVLVTLFAVAATSASGCAGSEETRSDDEPAAPSGRVHVGEFIAHVSPRRGTISFERVARTPRGPGVTPQSLDEITLTQDNVPGSGPANTVELVTNSTGIDGECPAGFQTKTFCGNVTLRSFYAGRALSNVYVQATKITDNDGNDLSGHSGKNSDASYVVGASTLLSNTLGLWRYTGSGVTTPGVIAQSTATNGGGNAGSRDWVFDNPDGADTHIHLHVFATLTYSSYTFSSLSPTLPTINNACVQGGTKNLSQSSGISMFQMNVPFPFTLYGTTYLPGTTAGKLTMSRYGAIGFGALSTATGSAYNTGTNVALPSTAAAAHRPAIYPFWENLNYTTNNSTITNSPSGVCTLVSGAEPNRLLVVTWHDMKFTGDTGAVYPGSPNITFSAILHEGSDVIDFAYGVMANSVASRANGGAATIGVQNEAGTVATAKNSVAGSVTTNTVVGNGCKYTLTPNP